jgi:hypothetical protein
MIESLALAKNNQTRDRVRVFSWSTEPRHRVKGRCLLIPKRSKLGLGTLCGFCGPVLWYMTGRVPVLSLRIQSLRARTRRLLPSTIGYPVCEHALNFRFQ